MSRIIESEVKCACCGEEVSIDRILSYSYENIGLSGNKHSSMQYFMEECPNCHYTSLDIEDESVRVTKGMLNGFRMKPGTENITDDKFISILKAAYIYEKNKDYLRYEYVLRLASFYAEDLNEMSLSKSFLRQANEAAEKYVGEKEELDISDLRLGIKLVDGNRRLGQLATAKNMCNEILKLIENLNDSEIDEIRLILNFENTLLDNRDITEHYINEVF